MAAILLMDFLRADTVRVLCGANGAVRVIPPTITRLSEPLDQDFRACWTFAAAKASREVQARYACSGGGVLRGQNAIPFGDIRTLVPGAGQLADDALGETLTLLNELENDRDVLVLKSEDRMTGVVESIGPAVVAFSARVGSVDVERALIRGVAFSKTLKPYVPREGVLAEIRLVDGSIVLGEIRVASRRSYALKSVLGLQWEVDVSDIEEIRFGGGKLTWVSDLAPTNSTVVPFFNRSWPWRANRSVWGNVLTVGGRAYERGIGCHARTELTYELDGKYKLFIADVGIDDETRGAGSALVSVRGDNVTLAKPAEVTGGRAAVRIRVDVSGVRRLTLLVDFGKNQDIGDHVDWLNPRLIRK